MVPDKLGRIETSRLLILPSMSFEGEKRIEASYVLRRREEKCLSMSYVYVLCLCLMSMSMSFEGEKRIEAYIEGEKSLLRYCCSTEL